MGRDRNRYRFRSVWRIDADPDAVYAVLRDAASYPSWWPQVRETRQLDDTSGEIRCRSMLPYDLVFVVRREIEDPVARILRGTLTGDLIGTSQWTIEAGEQAGAVAVFDEDVAVGKSIVRTAGALARPALKFNHGLMMRAGEQGLRKHLATVGA